MLRHSVNRASPARQSPETCEVREPPPPPIVEIGELTLQNSLSRTRIINARDLLSESETPTYRPGFRLQSCCLDLACSRCGSTKAGQRRHKYLLESCICEHDLSLPASNSGSSPRQRRTMLARNSVCCGCPVAVSPVYLVVDLACVDEEHLVGPVSVLLASIEKPQRHGERHGEEHICSSSDDYVQRFESQD